MNGISDDEFQKMLDALDVAAGKAYSALDGEFEEFYRQLRALSPEEIDTITPDISDQVDYERLLALVQEATERNLSQAQLASRIKALGQTAVEIAKKTTALPSSLFG